jgi:hypothetical protein
MQHIIPANLSTGCRGGGSLTEAPKEHEAGNSAARQAQSAHQAGAKLGHVPWDNGQDENPPAIRSNDHILAE